MKAYKVELLIIDFDQLGVDGVRQEIENANYANDCINPHVMLMEARDIGEWSDDHPLNNIEKSDEAYKELFPSST